MYNNIMENKKEKLEKIIFASDLPEHDKKKWFEFFDVNAPEAWDVYLEIFSVFPEEIGWFNQIMKRKVAAMILMKEGNQKGEQEIKNIIEEEKKKIIELAERI
ncbi:MAG TPA: hypothetical protein DD451_00175 [Candidatus Moranbacteria bacterium]|nr:hypothetical protein [Candidatus Moranbacteria bacterium]